MTSFAVGQPLQQMVQVLARTVADWSTGGPQYLLPSPPPNGCFLLQVVAFNSTGTQPATVSIGTPANGVSSLISGVALPVVAGTAARLWTPAAQTVSPGDIVVAVPSNAAAGKCTFLLIGFVL